MPSFKKLTSKIIPLPLDNIDTDQIIPARFLKAIDKESVVEGLFADWRYQSDGKPIPEFVLNQPAYQGANILLTGDNFGCGSSREHAPWALVGWGIHAIISTSFADIFNNNALKNGLLPILVDTKTHQSLFDLAEENPDAMLKINLEDQTVTLPNKNSFEFPIDAFAKKCLLNGMDQFGYIMSFESQIRDFESTQIEAGSII
ncbi:MAG: 3-isopropylmalate dehydratase small subunit [Chloroflexi bacterium]|nr:3-isopropylmalate dehydratase small subunit [Chloroflexota bacterium]